MKDRLDCRSEAENQDREAAARSPAKSSSANTGMVARATARLDSRHFRGKTDRIWCFECRRESKMILRFLTMNTGLKGGNCRDRNNQEAEQV